MIRDAWNVTICDLTRQALQSHFVSGGPQSDVTRLPSPNLDGDLERFDTHSVPMAPKASQQKSTSNGSTKDIRSFFGGGSAGTSSQSTPGQSQSNKKSQSTAVRLFLESKVFYGAY